MTSGNTDLNLIQKTLHLIESDARVNCPIGELHVVLSAVSVAKHSSQYWHDNYSKWISEFGGISSQNRTNGDINWAVVGGADVAAAVAVGVGTSSALIVPFVGWTFWGVVTGGAAVVTSGGSALIYAFSSGPVVSL